MKFLKTIRGGGFMSNNKQESPADGAVQFQGTDDILGTPPKSKLICIEGFFNDRLDALIVNLSNTEQTIGREPSNTVCIPYKKISRHHIRIYPDSGDWSIEDLNSTNGLFINDVKTAQCRLVPGDLVRIGAIVFRYEISGMTDAPSLNHESNQDYSDDITIFAGNLEGQHAYQQERGLDQNDTTPHMFKGSPQTREDLATREKTTGIHRWLIPLGIFIAIISIVLGAIFLYLNY